MHGLSFAPKYHRYVECEDYAGWLLDTPIFGFGFSSVHQGEITKEHYAIIKDGGSIVIIDLKHTEMPVSTSIASEALQAAQSQPVQPPWSEADRFSQEMRLKFLDKLLATKGGAQGEELRQLQAARAHLARELAAGRYLLLSLNQDGSNEAATQSPSEQECDDTNI